MSTSQEKKATVELPGEAEECIGAGRLVDIRGGARGCAGT